MGQTSSERPFRAERTLEDAFRAWSLFFREGVRTSRRFHLLLPAELEVDLQGYARRRSLSLAEAMRSLTAGALEAEHGEAVVARTDSPAALAALTASEHAVLMIASVLPEGQRRMRELAPAAALAAEERLAQFRESDL